MQDPTREETRLQNYLTEAKSLEHKLAKNGLSPEKQRERLKRLNQLRVTLIPQAQSQLAYA